MAKFVDRYCFNQGHIEYPSEVSLKLYELRKIVKGKPQPVDEEAVRDFKQYLNKKLVIAEHSSDFGSLSDVIGFSIVSDGFGGLFLWADKKEDYNILFETPFKRYGSGVWDEGKFDEMGIGCAWYNKVIGKENDLWTELVLKPGTPPDIDRKNFEQNKKKYVETTIPNGPLFTEVCE